MVGVLRVAFVTAALWPAVAAAAPERTNPALPPAPLMPATPPSVTPLTAGALVVPWHQPSTASRVDPLALRLDASVAHKVLLPDCTVLLGRRLEWPPAGNGRPSSLYLLEMPALYASLLGWQPGPPSAGALAARDPRPPLRFWIRLRRLGATIAFALRF